MSLPALAQLTDIEARLPSTFTIEAPRTTVLLQDASAVARRISKQDFTIETTTDQVRPIANRLRLAQKPVIAVTDVSVVLPGSSALVSLPGWYWGGGNEVWLLVGDQVINLPEELAGLLRYQTPLCHVTYTHGYVLVPDDVVGVVCSMVIRTLTAPGLGGVVSETVGEYSYRLSDAAAQGTMAVTKAEEDLLKGYRSRQKSTAELRW